MAFSLGGSKNKNKSSMDQNVWGPQGDALSGMYNQAGSVYPGMQNFANLGMGMAPGMQDQMTDVYNRAGGGMDQMLGGGSMGDTSGIRDMLNQSFADGGGRSNVGTMYESIVGGAGNSYIDPMVQSMKDGMQQNLQRMQSGTGLDAAAMGQGGSNRHAMQNAMQGNQANMDMANMENQMRGNAYDTDLNWKMNIAQQADSNRGVNQQNMMQALGMGDQNVGTGMNYGQSAQNLGMGQMAPWMMAMQGAGMPTDMWANTLGDPQVLSSGSSKGKGGSFGFGVG